MSRFVLLCFLPVLASCAAPSVHPPVMVCPTLPTTGPSPHEDPLPPVSATPMTLQPGHWDWADGSYVWSPPVWVPRSGAGKPVWQPGFWTPNGGACVWNPGHFLS